MPFSVMQITVSLIISTVLFLWAEVAGDSSRAILQGVDMKMSVTVSKSTSGINELHCHRECIRYQDCSSFNHQDATGTCELMTGVLIYDLVAAVGWNTFYRIDSMVPNKPADCREAKLMGYTTGVTKIFIGSDLEREVYCDHDMDGGGWMAVLRRMKQDDGQLEFKRKWGAYVAGFGDLEREHWIGLDVLHKLTQLKTYECFVDMNVGTDYAISYYDGFEVGGPDGNFELTVGTYESSKSNAGDSLRRHSGKQFSTYEKDNDNWNSNCATTTAGGGWWFGTCFSTNPTARHGYGIAPAYRLRKYMMFASWRALFSPNSHLSAFNLMIRVKEN